jgi:hypothetical protein
MYIQNLKGFPFNKPPKPCKQIFFVNPWMLPCSDRYWTTQHFLCDWLCKESNEDWDKKKCRTENCDAFRYIAGKTDIELTADNIIKALEGKKFKGFEMISWIRCDVCHGIGYIVNDGDFEGPCDDCMGEGYFLANELRPVKEE